MRLCATCTFPVGEHPDDGLVHPWDCLNLDDLFIPQIDVTMDGHGNRVERPRRTHSRKCPDGSSREASFEPDEAAKVEACSLSPTDYAGKVRLRGYQVDAMEPLRDGREEVRLFGLSCGHCSEPLLAVIVDQNDSSSAVRPMIGQSAQVLVAACPCGAAAAIVPLWGGVTGYAAALDAVTDELAEVTVPSDNWPPAPDPEALLAQLDAALE